MAKTIMVHVMPEETRMALCEHRELLEVAVERTQAHHVVGNIYKGKINNILPGMQAAFIDIGWEKNAFLYIGDLMPEDFPAFSGGKLTAGQDILIQIVKDSIGSKGPRATTHLTLPGRYVVLMPTADYIGVSRRIASSDERERLKAIAEQVQPSGMGMIVRTAAEGKSAADIGKDIVYLTNLWSALSARAKCSSAPTLLYRDVDLVIRIVRDYLGSDIDALVIDQYEAYMRACDLLKFISPDMLSKVKLYRGSQPLFTHGGLDEELAKLGQRQVCLKSGGYIVIDTTEALTVIDVNTGKYVGRTSLADTVFDTNMEAVDEIARQIRLRDIGGIIVIDFIDMELSGHKQAVLDRLAEQLKSDKTKTNIVGLTGLGLVEMTRKKVRQNFEGVLYDTCPCCQGRGRVESPETVSINVRRSLRAIVRQKPAGGKLVVQMHPRVAGLFDSNAIDTLEQELGKRIAVEPTAALHPEVYCILQAND